MRVVVTGAAGFLGKYIIENLHARYPGAQVFGIGRHAAPGIEAMVLPSETFCHLVRDISPDVLIHAASPASVPFSVQHPFADFTGSVGVFAHVLDCVRLYAPACKVVLLSSAAVYGDPIILPVHEQSTLAPVSPYGFHKQMCELLAQEYVRVYGLKVAGVRIFSAYGNGLRRQLLWDICQQVLQTGAIYLSGTGQETRDFVHVLDVAQAVGCVVENARFEADFYNVACGQAIKVAEVAQLVVDAFGESVPISFNGQQRAGDPLYWCADIDAIRQLGFEPSVRLNNGVKSYVQWVKYGA